MTSGIAVRKLNRADDLLFYDPIPVFLFQAIFLTCGRY